MRGLAGDLLGAVQDGVEDVADVGERVGRGDQRRVHAQFETAGKFFRVRAGDAGDPKRGAGPGAGRVIAVSPAGG